MPLCFIARPCLKQNKTKQDKNQNQLASTIFCGVPVIFNGTQTHNPNRNPKPKLGPNPKANPNLKPTLTPVLTSVLNLLLNSPKH
jgi:hypothetical protein